MSKRIIFIGLFSLSIFSFSPMIYAEQYYDQYSGNSFLPRHEMAAYTKTSDGLIFHNAAYDESYFCPVNFNIPDGSTCFIKSIGMRFYDNQTDAYINVQLKRKNLYTGACHIVAEWSSGLTEESGSVQTASQGTITGKKLVDTKKFAYFLCAEFYKSGDVNPGTTLMLYQVRIHYGT